MSEPATGVQAAASVAATAGLFGADPYLIAFFGVGITTIGMSIMGSAFSFAFGRRSKGRPLLFFEFLAAAGIGASAVTAIPALFGLEPVAHEAQPVVGFFYALFARWMMPVLIDFIPHLLRRWLNVPEATEKP